MGMVVVHKYICTVKQHQNNDFETFIIVVIYVYILSLYYPFSDRVGLPLHNIHIPSLFTSIMDIFFVDLKFGHMCFYTL